MDASVPGRHLRLLAGHPLQPRLPINLATCLFVVVAWIYRHAAVMLSWKERGNRLGAVPDGIAVVQDVRPREGISLKN